MCVYCLCWCARFSPSTPSPFPPLARTREACVIVGLVDEQQFLTPLLCSLPTCCGTLGDQNINTQKGTTASEGRGNEKGRDAVMDPFEIIDPSIRLPLEWCVS